MCFISNVTVNLKNPLIVFTTLITLHKLGECGRGWGGGGQTEWDHFSYL